MPDLNLLAGDLKKPVALRSLTATGQAVVAQRNGQFISVDIVTGTTSPLFKLPAKLNSFDISEDGDTLYAVSDTHGLVKDRLSGGRAKKLVKNAVNPTSVVLLADGTLLMAEGSATGRLFAINETLKTLDILTSSLNQAVAVVKKESSGRIFIAEASNGGRLLEHLADGSSVIVFSALGAITDICWLDNQQEKLIVADKAGKRILLADVSQPAVPPVELFSAIEDIWAAQSFGGNRIIVGAGKQVFIGEVQTDPITIAVPDEELFIAGWVRAAVKINDPSINFDDLEFIIRPELSGAMVSYSRDNSFDPANPHIVITAGWMPGEHEIHVINLGNPVTQTKFNVLENWTNQDYGPSVSTFGSVEAGPSGGTWGGPDSGDFRVPQNVNVIPAVGTRNVGVVLVDTSSARYPTGAALNTIITNIRNEMVNGVLIGGQLRSVAAYFNQASDNVFNINLVGIVGPIMLPNNWNSYFTFSDPDGDGAGTWVPNEDVDSTVISQIVQQNVNAEQNGNPPILDLTQMDSIIYVFRSRVSPPDPDLFAWPRASLSTKQHLIGIDTSGFFPFPQFRGIARVWMPDDWATRTVREFHETVAHELGHNLGLIDQYNQTTYSADAQSRIADFNPANSWELMSWERNLPLPSAAHRLMLGWLNPNAVRMYNFGVFGAIDETITLHAASLGAPPAGRFAAAEVRLEDGKNYYFEYRPATAGNIVDQNPPKANAVLGTEALFRTTNPTDRPNILRVEEDVDAVTDNGSFAVTEDFRDRDTTTPGFEQDFIVDVTSTAADSATIRVRYAADLKPDPSITPWSPGTNWQSPDIEVINGRSLADPAFRNIPWEGHDNTVITRVTNRGSSAASAVKVKFFAKDFTFGGGTEVLLGEQTQDIPVGATVTYTAPSPWRPPTIWLPFGSIQFTQHACLVARIDPFLDPVSNIWEVTPENNEAQSNYTWMASTTSSPASREATVMVAENTLKHPALVYFTIHQPNPLFRVYLDHRWVYLQPGEKKQILVMSESVLGDKRFDPLSSQYQHRERRIMTNLRLSALGDTRHSCAAEVIGGASLMVMTGTGTQFREFQAEHGLARGFIARTDTGAGVSGKVIVSIKPRDPDARRTEIVRETFAQAGEFRVELGDQEDVIVQGHYLGQFPFGPCHSKEVHL